MKHVWGPSRVGHGEAQCINCLMTNREAWVLGDECEKPYTPKPIKCEPAAVIDFAARAQAIRARGEK